MRDAATIIRDMRALADELEEALNAPPKPRRARARAVSRKNPKVKPTDLQRAQARRLLRDRGLIL